MKMKSIIILLFNLCLLRAAVSWSQEDEDRIEEYILDTYMPINCIPGLIVTIVENGSIVLAKGYGHKSVEEGVLADGNTLMSIGSNTKGFTGVLVAKTLHEMFPELGSAVLDTPIQKLMPNRNITFSDRYRSEMMTFRDLLSHRNCLKSSDLDIIFNTVSSIEEKIYRTRYQPEVCHFRVGYFYNNGLTALAGDLAAEIKGVPFTILLQEFMSEIGMEGAALFDNDGAFESLPHMSSAYYSKENETEVHPFNRKMLRGLHTAIGAGGILSSAIDMGAYMLFHLNRGRVGDRQVVPEEVMDWVYKIANADIITVNGKVPGGSDAVNANYGYSLGLSHHLVNGWKQIWHNGYWPPFYSDISMYPDLKHAIFIASNGPGVTGIESGLPHPVLALEILSILQEVNYAILSRNSHHLNFDPWISPSNSGSEALKLMKRKEGGRLDELVGSYGNPVAGDLIIGFDLEDAEMLQMKLGEFGVGRLIPRQDEPFRFNIQWKTDIDQFLHALDNGTFEFASVLDMSNEKTAIYFGEAFIKDENLGTFPSIPWAPDSCAPLRHHTEL